MKKQHIYLLVGIAWLSCCIYQLKNSNMFMVVVSAIISVLFFALAIYTKNKNKQSKNNDND
jgi:preprotein translocase subunit SecG